MTLPTTVADLTVSTALYTLLEQSDVFVDACVSDLNTQLLFLSVYGRDTSLQQLMARLHQPTSQGGVESLTLGQPGGSLVDFKALVGDAKRLEKIAGRMPKAGLLGNLAHAWIFDRRLLELDHAARAGWLFDQQHGRAVPNGDAWRLVQELSSVPLLPSWREPVLAHLQATRAMVRAASIGPVCAVRIELPEDFPKWVSDRLREGHLDVEAAT